MSLSVFGKVFGFTLIVHLLIEGGKCRYERASGLEPTSPLVAETVALKQGCVQRPMTNDRRHTLLRKRFDSSGLLPIPQ